MRFKSIKTKVLFWFSAVTILILLLFNTALYHFLEENTKLNIQNKFYNKAVFINKKIIEGIPVNKLLEDEQLAQVDVAIIKDDKVLFKKGKTGFGKFKRFIKEKKSFFVFERGEKLDGLYVLKIYQPFKGAILFFEPDIDKEIENNAQQIKEVLLALEPLLLLFLIFAASKLSDKILRSIKKVTEAANSIYVSDLTQEIPQPKYDDELKDLTDSFNQMIKRLREGVELLEQFNSDVSHELKTPLTVIRSEIEITLNQTREPEYYIKSLKTIENEAGQIQTIVDNLLLLTRYTKENIEQTFTDVSLDSVLLETVEKFSKQLKQKSIKLHIEKLEPLNLHANQMLMATIFSNLMDNAIKYTPGGRNIYVGLYADEKIHFFVRDEGIGIPKEQIEKITQRFYRVDESRSKKIKGYGLGLSIVKNSVELHGGSINIESDQGSGTKAEVVL